MKHLKIFHVDFPDSYLANWFTHILEKRFSVEVTDKNPDFIFCSGRDYKYLEFDCPRIFWTGENIRPNFNSYDYALGFDWMIFEDRYYRLPLYRLEAQFDDLLAPKHFTQQFIREQKLRFCDYIYSNELGETARRDFFHRLSQYKRVDAGGRHLNNMGAPIPWDELGLNKLRFQQEAKFSIAFENTSTSGYTTEKLSQPLRARSIPIYWGNPNVARDFNEQAFINCHQYDSWDQVIAKIVEIDNNDELYLRILNAPVFPEGKLSQYLEENAIANYLEYVCSQPRHKAFRRHRKMHERDLEDDSRMAAMVRRQMKNNS